MPGEVPEKSLLTHKVLLVLGILMLAKAIFVIARPSAAKRLATWWAKIVPKVNTLLGLACVAAAGCLWVVVLAQQKIVDWILLGLGGILVWIGTVYFRPETFRNAIDNAILKRSDTTIRLFFLLVGLGAVAFIVVAMLQL
jgi:hypothetical protein